MDTKRKDKKSELDKAKESSYFWKCASFAAVMCGFAAGLFLGMGLAIFKASTRVEEILVCSDMECIKTIANGYLDKVEPWALIGAGLGMIVIPILVIVFVITVKWVIYEIVDAVVQRMNDKASDSEESDNDD